MKKFRKRETHYYIYRRNADGVRGNERLPIVKRAPLRVDTYTTAERIMIFELAIFYSIDRGHVWVQDINHLMLAQLCLQKCRDLVESDVYAVVLVREFIRLKLLKVTDGRKPRRSDLLITTKGKRHIKRQPRRLQLCAQKLVYVDLLDKLVRAVG